jgi:mannosidase alpha-like ER degradation enhancer 3
MLQVKGRVGVADPLRVCGDLLNPQRLRGRIAILERGDCMFVEKVCASLGCVSSLEPCMTVFFLSGLGNVMF